MRSSYGIREVFGTLQGEGAQAGAPAVFLRFAGCNLGYEVCPWCDTDWVKAAHTLDLDGVIALVEEAAREHFGGVRDGLLLVATGGEPTLQLDRGLTDALRQRGFRVAMETNGSRPVAPDLVDWLTVSPKQPGYVQREGNELKVVFTGGAPGVAPDVAAVRRLAEGTRFDHYFVQPLELPGSGPNYAEAAAAVMELGPPWRLAIQAHKVIGLP
jgi:7-carboxy-7-deazaguanine synthase